MKFNKFLFGAAALSMGVFASCSSDEPVKGPDGGNGSTDVDRYMSVRITNPANYGSRAEEDQDPVGPGFELGKNNENTILPSNVRFYFFNADGQPFTLAAGNVSGTVTPNNMVEPIELNQFNQDGNKESTLEGVLVLGKPTAPYIGQTPSYVVCVANLTTGEFEALKNKSLSAIANATTSKTPDESSNKFDWSSFKMISSTYFDDTEKVMYSKITADNLAETPEAAKAAPVDIYIERIAAKVRATGLKTWKSMQSDGDGGVKDVKYNIVDASGDPTATTLYVNLTGWKLRNRYVKANLFKEINANGNYFDAWNVPTFHRSYWEQTSNDATNLFDRTYDITDEADFYRGNYVDNAEGAEYLKNVAYTYPNTAWASGSDAYVPDFASDRATCSTAIVVRGIVCSDEEGKNPVNLIRWAGVYYLESTFKQMVITAYNAQFETNLGADQVHFIPGAPNKWIAAVGQNNATMNNRYFDIERWVDGQTSFYVNIKHANNGNTPLYGVVRNHIYDYTFDNVIGLGLPGNTPENPVDETESYIAARLNVLNWKVVSNTVTLE